MQCYGKRARACHTQHLDDTADLHEAALGGRIWPTWKLIGQRFRARARRLLGLFLDSWLVRNAMAETMAKVLFRRQADRLLTC